MKVKHKISPTKMASCQFTCCNFVNHRHHNHNHNRAPPPLSSCTAETTKSTTFGSPSYSYPFKLNRRNSFPSTLSSRSGCCRATDPKSEPPPEKHLSPVSGTIFAPLLNFESLPLILTVIITFLLVNYGV